MHHYFDIRLIKMCVWSESLCRSHGDVEDRKVLRFYRSQLILQTGCKMRSQIHSLDIWGACGSHSRATIFEWFFQTAKSFPATFRTANASSTGRGNGRDLPGALSFLLATRPQTRLLFWARCSCTQPPAEFCSRNSRRERRKRRGERQRHPESPPANIDTSREHVSLKRQRLHLKTFQWASALAAFFIKMEN